MKLVALALLVASSAVAEPAPDLPEHRVKRLIDRYRAAVGLPGVELDPQLSKGCMEHAAYMKLNRGTEAVYGLNAHRQRNLPGATRAGAACARGADIFNGVSDLEVAVDAWMAGLYHRRPILAAPLGKIGVGYAKLPDGMYMAVLAFADGTDPSLETKWPIAYPGNKQTGVPLDFSWEVPNPIPGGGRAGYPITFQFPPLDKVTGVKATLTADGKPVEFHLSSPERPATTHRQYGMVCLIPKLPLSPATTYDVRVEAIWNGKPVSHAWSFTTVSLRPVDAHDEAAMEKAINVASTVRGTAVLAGWANGQIAFLQIGEKKLRRYKMISVLIPRAVWQQLGGSRLIGKTIEVDGTPYLVEGKFLNVPITVASQLRVVK